MKENGGAACHDVAPPLVKKEKVQEVQVFTGCDGIAAYGTAVQEVQVVQVFSRVESIEPTLFPDVHLLDLGHLAEALQDDADSEAFSFEGFLPRSGDVLRGVVASHEEQGRGNADGVEEGTQLIHVAAQLGHLQTVDDEGGQHPFCPGAQLSK